MKFSVTLRKGEATRTVEFQCENDAMSVLEQQVYDTVAEEDEWIVVGTLVRVPTPETP